MVYFVYMAYSHMNMPSHTNRYMFIKSPKQICNKFLFTCEYLYVIISSTHA